MQLFKRYVAVVLWSDFFSRNSLSLFIFLVVSEAATGEVFVKKRCSYNFAKFAGKHLCQNLFFNKVAVTFFAEQNRLLLPFLAIICKCFRKINLNFHGKSVPYLANNFMLKGNRNTRQAYEISSKLSTLNIFYTFVYFFYWLWTCKFLLDSSLIGTLPVNLILNLGKF